MPLQSPHSASFAPSVVIVILTLAHIRRSFWEIALISLEFMLDIRPLYNQVHRGGAKIQRKIFFLIQSGDDD